MTTFKLFKVGQNILINEFRGTSIMQSGNYLQIVNPGNEMLVSLILEPGYYSTEASAMVNSLEQPTGTSPLQPLRIGIEECFSRSRISTSCSRSLAAPVL